MRKVLNQLLDQLSHGDLCLALVYVIWLKFRSIHWSIKFALKAALFSFGLIWIMPLKPMAIPAAFGGGLSVALISEII